MACTKALIIGGPTAVGKSDIAVDIAHRYNGEILSADSRQVYKGLDIGSGKITFQEMKNIPHHMLDIVSPEKIYTAYQFAQEAFPIVKTIQQKNILPIVVGGTGFYIHALQYANSIEPYPTDPEKRNTLEKMSTEQLVTHVKNMHGDIHIDTNNRQKLIRAIEREHPPQKNRLLNPRFPHLFVVYAPPKETIFKNIDVRLKKRWDGIVEEVQTLIKNGLATERMFQLGLEYRYVSQMLVGTYTEAEAYALLNTAIRHYAKRQLTWFKKYGDIHVKNKQELFHEVETYMHD